MEICEKCKINLAKFMCNQCKNFLCEGCNKLIHKQINMKNHVII